MNQLKQVVTNDGRNSYFEQVGAGSTTSVQQYNTSRPITKNGYVYAFVSNETQNIYTYWDDLQVSHIKGPLLQEEGYYPFGLEMKAIGSQAAVKQQTRYKFNAGTVLEDNFDVNYYETYFRQYDAQIGRFTGIDALAETTIGISTYQFGNNTPVLFNDPTGLQIDASPKGPLENLNPNLRTEPRWLTDYWDNYWSDPYNIYGPGGSSWSPADYSEFWNMALNLYDGGEEFINRAYIDNEYSTERFWYSNGVNAVFNTAGFHGDVSLTENEYYFYLGKTEPHTQQGDRGSQQTEGWEIASKLNDVVGVSTDLTLNSIVGAQKLANVASGTNSTIIDLAKLKLVKGLTVEGASRTLGIAATVYNGIQLVEKPTWGRALNTVVSGVTLVPGWGWAVGAAYFFVDLGWQATHNGKSIAESIDGE